MNGGGVIVFELFNGGVILLQHADAKDRLLIVVGVDGHGSLPAEKIAE
jgi:hypothetical protein